MIDLSKLSSAEFQELEKQLEEYKKTKEDLKGWKITFTIRYSPFKSPTLTKGEFGEESIGDLMANEIANLIMRRLCLSAPEDVSGCEVVEATKEELEW